MPAALTVTLETQDPRIAIDRMALVADGRKWDLDASLNIGIEPLAYTGMLFPIPFTPEWQTTATGPYARLHKADLSIATPDKHTELQSRFDGDTYIVNLGVNEPWYTNQVWPQNQPMFISWYSFQTGNDDFVQLECGWGLDTDADVQLRFWSNGQLEVWKNGSLVGKGNIDVLETRIELPAGQGKLKYDGHVKSFVGQTIDVALIPGRRREILLLTNQGGGYRQVFEDISDEDINPMITGPGQFWVNAPVGQAKVLLAPMRFLTDGYFLGPVNTLRYPPVTGATPTLRTFYDPPYNGPVSVVTTLKEPDGVTDFVPDGVKRQARLRIDVVGGGNRTPFIYGAEAVYSPEVLPTPLGGFEMSDFITRKTLSVPESPADVTFSMEFKEPLAIEGLGLSNFRRLSNRPIQVQLLGNNVLTGRTKEPRWSDSHSDETRRETIEAQDFWRALETYEISEPTPFDGLYLSDAIRQLVLMTGVQLSAVQVEDIDFVLPTGDPSGKGDWALIPKMGDKAASWIQRLHQTYAGFYHYGWYPTPSGTVFRFMHPDSLGTTPVAFLYETSEDAFSQSAFIGDCVRVIDERTMEPEANEVWVVGRDPRTNLPIVAMYRDPFSQDPTLAINARPPNWLGEPRRFSWVDPSITSIFAAFWSVATFVERLFVPKTCIEIECQMMVRGDGCPAWRGDCFAIYGPGLVLRGIYRIMSLHVEFEVDHIGTDDILNGLYDYSNFDYRAQYVAERVA